MAGPMFVAVGVLGISAVKLFDVGKIEGSKIDPRKISGWSIVCILLGLCLIFHYERGDCQMTPIILVTMACGAFIMADAARCHPAFCHKAFTWKGNNVSEGHFFFWVLFITSWVLLVMALNWHKIVLILNSFD